MRTLLVTGASLALGLFALPVMASGPAARAPGRGAAHAEALDLNDPAVLARIECSDPAEFAKIERLLAGLRAHPQRAESNWLEVNFHARDVELMRHLFLMSLPPRQLLRFTLDDVRYRALITRSDLIGHTVRACTAQRGLRRCT
jgi:hypothetical protein